MRTIRIEEGRRVGFTSDTHYGHRKILVYCNRPWLWFDTDNHVREQGGEPLKVSDEALATHNKALVDSTNDLLGPDDILIHCGDVAWGKPGASGLRALQEYRDRLKVGTVYVTVGNHDDDDDLASVFGADRVFERFLLTIEGKSSTRNVIVEHYPGGSWRGSHKGYAHVHGHTHHHGDKIWGPGNQVDCGVDGHGYRPWLWHEELMPALDRRLTLAEVS